MLFSDVLELVSVVIEKDELEQEIETETLRQVFCNRQSISQNEFFQAGQTGIKSAYKFVINSLDYQDETQLRYREKDYSIYRTFEKNDYTELYCEVRVGG